MGKVIVPDVVECAGGRAEGGDCGFAYVRWEAIA